jgi:hypothetical protein
MLVSITRITRSVTRWKPHQNGSVRLLLIFWCLEIFLRSCVIIEKELGFFAAELSQSNAEGKVMDTINAQQFVRYDRQCHLTLLFRVTLKTRTMTDRS